MHILHVLSKLYSGYTGTLFCLTHTVCRLLSARLSSKIQSTQRPPLRRTMGYLGDMSGQNYVCCWIGSEHVVRQICSMLSGGKYVLRKHIRFVHSERVIQREVHDTMTEMVEVADEMFNRTMAVAMFRHQRTHVVPPRTPHHVSPLYLGLYEVQQEAACLPFPSGMVVFFSVVQASYRLWLGLNLTVAC